MVDIKDNLFGTLAVRSHFVLPEQVSEALAAQLKYELSGQPCPRLGEILAAKGYMTPAQVKAVLQGQEQQTGQRFGEMAIAWQFCQPEDIESALAHQSEMRAMNQRPPRLGEILVIRGKMKPHQIKAVLQGQGKQIVQCPQCTARYNAVNLTAGSRLTCPRCKHIFAPLSAAQEQLEHLDEDVRADQTVSLPAIQDRATAEAILKPKLEVGGYQLSTRLGSDHSGVLYKAFHPQTGNHVALRLLSLQVVQGAEQFDQWVSAGQTASELSHPHIQKILFMGSEGGRAFLVMEYVEGKSLRQRIQEQSRLPALEALEILIQCGEALAYGHARDLIHGDLRPHQILIGLDGRARLSGLGTPKHVLQDLKLMVGKAGAVPLYAAPEVLIDEEDADERSDLYSLAAIGYHMITGRPPHSGSNFMQASFRFASQEVLPPRAIDPNIAPYLSRLLLKGLSAEPDDRYASITSFLADLRKCRGGLLIQAPEIPDLAPDAGKSPHRPPRSRDKTERGASRFRTHKSRTGHGAPARGARSKPAAPAHRALQGKALSAAVLKKVPASPSGFHTASGGIPALTPETVSAIESLPEPLEIGPVAPLHETAASPSGATRALAPVEQDGVIEILPMRLTPPRSAPPVGLVPPRRTRKAAAPAPEAKAGFEFSPPVLAGLMVGLGLIVLVVVWAISGRKDSTPESTDESRHMQVHEIEKTDAASAVPEESASAKEIRKDFQANIEIFRKANPEKHQEIIQRLDQFLAKYSFDTSASGQLALAKELRGQHAQQGIEKTLPGLQETLLRLSSAGQFREAAAEANRWKLLWKDPAGELAAADALRQIDTREKAALEEQLGKAKALSERHDWAGARALYDTLITRHRTECATLAQMERLKNDQAEQAALVAEKLAEETRKRTEATSQRESAAPARYAKLLSDIRESLAQMDLEKAAAHLESATGELTGTSKGVDLQAVKNDLKRLRGLLDRMIQSAKEGKLRDLRVPFQNDTFGIADAAPTGPILDIKGGRIEVKWTSLSAEVLLEIAKRATDFAKGPALFDLGIYYLYLDQAIEAEKVLRMAGGLGQAVDAHISKVLARQKEPVGSAPKKDPAPAETPATPTVSGAGDSNPAASLKASGWEISKGKWTVTAEKTFLGEKNAESQVATLKRELKRFASLSVEMRGSCESAGFSFGAKERFVIKPSKTWQKLALEVDKSDRLRLLVDGVEAKSLEDSGALTSNLLPDTIYLRGKDGSIEFRNFTVDGKPVGAPSESSPAALAPAPSNQEAAPPQDPEAIKALSQLGWEISTGIWLLQNGVITAYKSEGIDIAYLKRAFKTFKNLSVEVRGNGDASGFSFGKGRRFLAKPSSEWQKVNLQMHPDGSLEFKINDEARSSLEDTAGIKGSDLGETLYLHHQGGKTEFRNFKLE